MDWLPRSQGSVRVDLVHRRGGTRLAVLEQSGAARLRFPKTAPGEPCEAVLINTAGGLTGGDSLTIAARLGDGASAVLTTAAAEKIYRARADAAAIAVALSVPAAPSWPGCRSRPSSSTVPASSARRRST